MKTLFIKDKNRRFFYFFLEKKRLILQHIIQNLNNPLDVRTAAQVELHNFFKKNSHTKIKNRCILSNRSRSVFRYTKVSRIFFKQYALEGTFMGIKKAS